MHPPGNHLPFPCKSLIFRREQTGSVYKETVEKQTSHADCKSVYTGSIPVLASTTSNDLRYFFPPRGSISNQLLDFSCCDLVLFHPTASILGICRQLAFRQHPAVLPWHLHLEMIRIGDLNYLSGPFRCKPFLWAVCDQGRPSRPFARFRRRQNGTANKAVGLSVVRGWN